MFPVLSHLRIFFQLKTFKVPPNHQLGAVQSADRSWPPSGARAITALCDVGHLGCKPGEVAAYFGRDVAMAAILGATKRERLQSDVKQAREVDESPR